MDEREELQELVVKLALLAQKLDERSQAAVQRVEQTGVALDRRAHTLGNSAEQFSRDALHTLQLRSGEALGSGIAQAVQQCNTQLQAAAKMVSANTQEMQQLHRALQQERKRWIWTGSAALLMGSLLATAAAAWTVASSRGQVARNKIEARLLRAYNQADVTLCGAQLCANVDNKAKPMGENGQYRPVKPR